MAANNQPRIDNAAPALRQQGVAPTTRVSPAAVYPYNADTNAPARRQGVVALAGVKWNCVGSRCSATGPSALPTVTACRALAEHVGPVQRYSHQGRMLSMADLQQCNAGIPSSARTGLSAGPPQGMNALVPKAVAPAANIPGILQNTGTSRGPVAVIHTAPLRYTDRGMMVINTAPLRFSDRGSVVIRASELRYTDRGAVVIRAKALVYSGRPH